MEGRKQSSGDLVQAILADQGLITALSSTILSNIVPQWKSTINEPVSALSSQIQTVNPGVSDDQTGMSTKKVNPGVSDDQTGSKRSKRPLEEPTALDNGIRAKRQRGPDALDAVTVPGDITDVDAIALDDEIASPNSRWEASEELTTVLGTTKRLNKFDRKALVKTYPRPDVDAVYTPAMDEFLKPFIQGIIAPDKPIKDMQDNFLDVFGSISTMYENLLAMLEEIGDDGVIELDKASVNAFLSCVKHALMLLGDASAGCSAQRRELVLKKINPLMASMAQEHFPDAKRHLFGSGFEQRLKTRSETAETIAKASKVTAPGKGKQFFRGMAFRGSYTPHGGRHQSTFRPFRGRGYRGRGFRQPNQTFPRLSTPQKFRANNQQQ